MTYDPAREAEAILKREATLQEEVKVTVRLPRWMAADMAERAKQAGLSVDLLVRRAVALDRTILSPGQEVIVRKDDGTEWTIAQL